MTVRVDYTQLDQPAITLVLEESYGGYFTVTDQAGRIYFPPTKSVDVAVRFMRAMQAKGHATLDEDSIEWFRALRAFGEPHSIKAPHSSSNVIQLRRRETA